MRQSDVARSENGVRPPPTPAGSGTMVQPEASAQPLLRPRRAIDRGIEDLCIERGLKMTGQRRTIARVLSEASDHPDVEELYRRAVLLDERMSIATVYRTVRLFEEKGILQRRDFGNGRARYEASDHGPHYHLIDVGSGKVVEFANPEHEELVRALVEQLGFEMVSMRLEVFARPLPAPADANQPKRRRKLGSR